MHHTWRMRRLHGALSWAFVRGPAAAYALADSGSSLFGIGAVLAMALVAALGAGIGALIALVTGRPVDDAAFVGGMIGLGTVIAYLVVMLVVVGVLWIRGVSPTETATGEKPAGRHAAAAYGWRRRGEPLVPGSLVLFFLIVAVPFGSLGLNARSAGRPAEHGGVRFPCKTTTARVRRPTARRPASDPSAWRVTGSGCSREADSHRPPRLPVTCFTWSVALRRRRRTGPAVTAAPTPSSPSANQARVGPTSHTATNVGGASAGTSTVPISVPLTAEEAAGFSHL